VESSQLHINTKSEEAQAVDKKNHEHHSFCTVDAQKTIGQKTLFLTLQMLISSNPDGQKF